MMCYSNRIFKKPVPPANYLQENIQRTDLCRNVIRSLERFNVCPSDEPPPAA